MCMWACACVYRLSIVCGRGKKLFWSKFILSLEDVIKINSHLSKVFEPQHLFYYTFFAPAFNTGQYFSSFYWLTFLIYSYLLGGVEVNYTLKTRNNKSGVPFAQSGGSIMSSLGTHKVCAPSLEFYAWKVFPVSLFKHYSGLLNIPKPCSWVAVLIREQHLIASVH